VKPPATRRRALLLLALTIVAGACSRAPRGPAHVRLVERIGRAEHVWPRIGRPQLPLVRDKRVELGPQRRLVKQLVRIRLGPRYDRDERIAVLMPPGGSTRFRVRVPEGAKLVTAAGTVSGTGAPARLRISLGPDAAEGGGTTTLGEYEPTPGSLPAWQEIRVDLSRWSGREVELTFAGEGGANAPWGAFAAPRLEGRGARDGRFNIVVISVDTLRADRLGAYGYARRPTSPRLDELAARMVRFEWAISQAPWTRPSHLALFTGRYPVPRNDTNLRPISELLWHEGYRTLAITGGGQVDSRFGFDRGFESYRMADWLRAPEMVFASVGDPGGAPFFLFLHTFEVHEPYTDRRFVDGMPAGRVGSEFTKDFVQTTRPGLTAEEKELASALYDGDIAFTDQQLGAFFDAAERAGWLDDTIFVLTSDHGEQFWEHGAWGHGQSLYDHQLHVPLLVHLPPALAAARSLTVGPGAVIGDQVQLVDLVPTLLELAGSRPPGPLDGRSLVPLLDGRGLPAGQAFAEGTNIRETERRGLRTSRYKFIHSIPRGPHDPALERFELFDLRDDPAERVDLAARHPDVVAGLAATVRLLSRGATLEFEGEVPVGTDPDLVEELKALGYIGN
jgi:arylsulfatase A-like enzyme